MSQTRESGAQANEFGRIAAATIASQIGAKKLGNGNEFEWKGKRITIRTARRRNNIVGVTNTMADRVELVVAAFEFAPNEYELLTLSPAKFKQHRRFSRGHENIGLVSKIWFVKEGEKLGTAKLDSVLPNKVVRFGDSSGDDTHDGFQEWLKSFPAGFYLNKIGNSTLLHTTHCHHYGRPDGSAPYGRMVSRTKICAASIRDLEAWAKSNGITIRRCQDCAPDLQQELLDNYRQAGRETGYWGRYFLREVQRKGGLATVKRMLSPSHSEKITDGWQALIDVGRIELSVESSVLKPEFQELFTEDELREAQRRQDLLPEFLQPKKVAAEDVFPDEVPDDTEMVEGAKKRVVVNAYERNPQAREACLAKFGRHCAVCGMSFKERYGDDAKRIIHVHHKKPLAARRGEEQTETDFGFDSSLP